MVQYALHRVIQCTLVTDSQYPTPWNHFQFFRNIYVKKILFMVAKPNAPFLFTITIPMYSPQNGLPL